MTIASTFLAISRIVVRVQRLPVTRARPPHRAIFSAEEPPSPAPAGTCELVLMFKPRRGSKNITSSRSKGSLEMPRERSVRFSQLSRNSWSCGDEDNARVERGVNHT